MQFKSALTPAQAAAFWRLKLLNGEDITRLAMNWLEGGAASDNLAVLAGERRPTLRDDGTLFEAGLKDIGAALDLDEKRATWLVIQTLLRAIADAHIETLDGVHDIVELHLAGRSLFAPRNLAGEGQAYAGEELGIETMLGIYWELDDERLSSKLRAKCMVDLRAEATRVLDAFYTVPLAS